MKFHYSLFHCQNREGNPSLIDLSKITHISVDETENLHVVFLSDSDWVHLCNVDGDLLVEAWNLYKYASNAAQLLKSPEITNPTIACQSALRLDEYIAFLAKEKLKELAALGGEG